MAMLKRGVDQVSAWILGTVLAGMIFGGVYGVAKLVGGGHGEGDEAHASAHGGGHGEERSKADEHASGHESSGHDEEHAKPEEHGSGHEPADHGEEHESAHDAEKKSKDSHAAEKSVAASAPVAAGGAHWEYNGSSGPEKWGVIDPSFELCKTGKHQTPIDIEAARADPKALPIRFSYKPGSLQLKNNGHTIQADVDRGNFIEVDGDRYDLVQFHWHAPSEHKVSGLGYDLELHFVHKNAAGRLAVVGVLYEEGGENKAMGPLWSQLPIDKGQTGAPVRFDPATLVPKSHLYYHYDGSLTTPPCSEGINWFVMTQSQPVSSQQVDLFQSIVGFSARPVQPLNGRVVTKSLR